MAPAAQWRGVTLLAPLSWYPPCPLDTVCPLHSASSRSRQASHEPRLTSDNAGRPLQWRSSPGAVHHVAGACSGRTDGLRQVALELWHNEDVAGNGGQPLGGAIARVRLARARHVALVPLLWREWAALPGADAREALVQTKLRTAGVTV